MSNAQTQTTMRVPFSYLDRQFVDLDAYLADLKQHVLSGDFTLGAALTEFEDRFAKYAGMPHAIGVGTGTDALAMSLKMLDIGHGDEVITTPMTFVATVGAIVQSGAKPVFVDSEDGYVIDAERIEATITERTKAIMPVHYTGNMADMPRIADIAEAHGLHIVEDACQAFGAAIDGKPAGSWGATAAFSLHPLKNLNVWGDAGMIVTRDDALADRLRLYRNHGLTDRDTVTTYGINCRLDTLQAVIGNRLIDETTFITDNRIAHAERYDAAFADLDDIEIPARRAGVKHVYHLYVLRIKGDRARRDRFVAYLNDHGIEAKVHYPTPMHLQPACNDLGHQRGDFPVAEDHSDHIFTLPAHQHLTEAEMDHTIQTVRRFFETEVSP